MRLRRARCTADSPWTGLRRRPTEWLLIRLPGATTAGLLMEGANDYVVAKKRPLKEASPR